MLRFIRKFKNMQKLFRISGISSLKVYSFYLRIFYLLKIKNPHKNAVQYKQKNLFISVF